MKWITVDKVAEALSVSNVRSVYNRANREKWEFRERNGREYLFASLPGEVQNIIAEYCAAQRRVKKESAHFAKKTSGKNNKIGFYRAAIIGKMRALCLTVEEFTSLYNLGRVRIDDEIKKKYPHLDDSTVYRWLALSPDGDPLKLSADYGRDSDGAGEKTLDLRDRSILESLYFTVNQWTATKCFRAWKAETGKDVSYSTVKRFFQSFPPAFHAWRRVGSKELNDKFLPYQVRDYTKYKPMELWVSDHHMLDVFCREGNRVFRPWITAFQDMRSRKIVGWHVSNKPSSYTILQSLYAGVCEHGLPDGVYFDNGADYRGERLQGKVVEMRSGEKIRIAGVFQKYHVDVHFAEPYHGQSKPIERFFRTVLEEFSKTFQSFAGSNTAQTLQENKENWKRISERITISIDEVAERWGKWVAEWNATWEHRGSGMNGRTPDSVFYNGLKNRLRIDIEDQYKQILFSKFEVHPITRNGVKFDNSTYYNPLFITLLGKKEHGESRKYKIVRDISDIGRVYVYDLDDNLICDATNNILFGSGKTEEDIIVVKSKRKEIKKALKGYLSASRELVGGTLEEQIINHDPVRCAVKEIETEKPSKKVSGSYWVR